MSSLEGQQRLRAPAGDGTILAVPPLQEVGDVLARNRQRLHDSAPTLGLPDRSWPELRRLARHELLDLARRYMDFFSPIDWPPLQRGEQEGPLFLAGHQPELFHPGVWIKNFALTCLARHHAGVAVNLIVDNDTLKSSVVRVPVSRSLERRWPQAVRVPFDRWHGEVPYEERRIEDKDLFASFGERVTDLLRPWGYTPLLPAFWEQVKFQAEATELIGESFASARRTLERAWGCDNLEVPLSQVCGSESFACFAGALLADLPRFVTLYNQIVQDYRNRNGIRSRNHPVPNLARDGDWLEAPFWGWRAGQSTPKRGRLFVRVAHDRLQLRAGAESWPDLPAPGSSEFVAAWRRLANAGYKVRSRALTTTLFSRLLLADLFIHGIGGGKYDELTDELMRRFFGIEPSEFIILSATRWLPLPAFPVDEQDKRRLAHRLRDLRYNPQRHLSAEQSASLAELIQDKQRWIERQPPDSAGRRERFRALRSINEQLQAPLAGELERTRKELACTEKQLLANVVLRRRDYAFCLYPEESLRPICASVM